MDIFMEYMIKRHKDTKDKIIIAGLIFLAILITLVLFAVMMFMAAQGITWSFSIGFLCVAFAWYGAILLISTRNIEWEYILTNNYFDVDKIMAKKGRKRVLSIDFSEAAIVAAVADNDHNHVYRNKDQSGLKVLDLTGGKEVGEVYFIDIQVEGQRKLVLFQPTSKMIEAIKKANPRNVYIYGSNNI